MTPERPEKHINTPSPQKEKVSLGRKLGDLRNTIETGEAIISPINKLKEEVVEELVGHLLVDQAFYDALERCFDINLPTDNINPYDFGKGIKEGLVSYIKSLAISGAKLAMLVNEHGQIGVDDFFEEFVDFADKPNSEFDRAIAKAKFMLEDIADYLDETNYEDVSYLSGRVMAIVFATLATRGTVNAASLRGYTGVSRGLKALSSGVKINRAVVAMQPEDQVLYSLISKDIALSVLRSGVNGIPDLHKNQKTLEHVLQRFHEKLKQKQDPLVLDAYADLIEDMYLADKDPQKYPIPKDSLDFLRSELVDLYRELFARRQVNKENYEAHTLALLSMTGGPSTILKALSEQEIADLLSLKEGTEHILKKLNLVPKNEQGLRVALRGAQKYLEEGVAPGPEVVERIFSVFQNEYLFRENKVAKTNKVKQV